MKNKQLRVAVYLRWEEKHSSAFIFSQYVNIHRYVEAKGWRVTRGGFYVDANMPPVYEHQMGLQDFVKRADDFDVLVVQDVEALGTHAMSVFPLIARLKIQGLDIHYSATGSREEKQALTMLYLAAKSALEAPEVGVSLSPKEVR